jgi:hypothetical protein
MNWLSISLLLAPFTTRSELADGTSYGMLSGDCAEHWIESMPRTSRRGQGLKKWFEKAMEALRTTHPSVSNPYWRELPLRRTGRLLVGTFLLASVGGFGANLTMLDHPSPLDDLLWPLLIASFATGILLIRLRKPRWVIPAFLLAAGLFWLVGRLQFLLPVPAQPWSMRQALLFNAFGIWIGAGVGSRVIMSFLSTEGAARVRMQTELALAHGIQTTLVPQISLRSERFEVFGISLPSTEMGGDLVDLVEREGSLTAYAADVSGHGLPAGQLMGMLKTAMRLGIELRQQPVALLENADRVLPSLKQPEMYATLALLCFDGSMEAEYSLAGHPPILHYRKGQKDVTLLVMQQLPLGLLLNPQYTSARASFDSGDLFFILTDGIIEVTDDLDEEFGLERVKRLLVQHAAEPLPKIWAAILSAAAAHGPQHDDQSGLLVRIR